MSDIRPVTVPYDDEDQERGFGRLWRDGWIYRGMRSRGVWKVEANPQSSYLQSGTHDE